MYEFPYVSTQYKLILFHQNAIQGNKIYEKTRE